eukprot:9834962-Ditylum_brightwellii.AAC.1
MLKGCLRKKLLLVGLRIREEGKEEERGDSEKIISASHNYLRDDGRDTPQDAQDAQPQCNSEIREEGKEGERGDLEETISASHNDLKDAVADTPQDAHPQRTLKDIFWTI